MTDLTSFLILKPFLCFCVHVSSLNASVVSLRPNAFNWDQVVRLSPTERLDHAFTVAKDQLAIERLLDPEGITCCKRKGTSQLPFLTAPQKYDWDVE